MVNPALNLSLNELRLIAEQKYKRLWKQICKRFDKSRGSRPRLRVEKSKLKEIKEDFYNLRHKFSKKDADKYRKLFMISKIIGTFLN